MRAQPRLDIGVADRLKHRAIRGHDEERQGLEEGAGVLLARRGGGRLGCVDDQVVERVLDLGHRHVHQGGRVALAGFGGVKEHAGGDVGRQPEVPRWGRRASNVYVWIYWSGRGEWGSRIIVGDRTT
jgi:hypothetical protein